MDFKNSYQIVLFGCCREIYRQTNYAGGFRTIEEATEFYKDMSLDEQVYELTKLQAEEDVKKAKKDLEKLKARKKS